MEYLQIENLKAKLNKICDTYIIKQLQKHLGKVYLYGSSITDTYYEIKYKDLDLIVDINNTFRLEEVLNELHLIYDKNKYGGYRFMYNNIKYDVLNLKDTVSMTLFNIEPNLDNLLTCCMFNTQCIYFDTNLKILYFNDIWDKAINSRMLDLVSKNTLFPEKLESLAIKYSRRYKMNLSKRLNSEIISNKNKSIIYK